MAGCYITLKVLCTLMACLSSAKVVSDLTALAKLANAAVIPFVVDKGSTRWMFFRKICNTLPRQVEVRDNRD